MADRPVLRFYIQPSWDHQPYVMYAYAPSDWDDRDPVERREFLEQEAHQFMENNLEYGGDVYDPETADRGWGEQGNSPDEPEQVFD